MLQLQNDALSVTLLDPEADKERFGTRYCTGGYIFQIEDARAGLLLSGPTYPDSFNTFDGQGIPDAFNRSPLRDPLSPEPAALIPGIGICDLKADTVLEFCDWDISHEPTEICFRTHHAFEHFNLELTRSVALHGRSVRSTTLLRNTGRPQIPVRWFPHPFFPHPETDALCKINIPLDLRDVLGYRMGDDGYIHRKGWPWDTDHYLALDHEADRSLILLQRHPALGQIAAITSYVPSLFPIWGNPRTFSFEPYLEGTASAGQALEWSIHYEF